MISTAMSFLDNTRAIRSIVAALLREAFFVYISCFMDSIGKGNQKSECPAAWDLSHDNLEPQKAGRTILLIAAVNREVTDSF